MSVDSLREVILWKRFTVGRKSLSSLLRIKSNGIKLRHQSLIANVIREIVSGMHLLAFRRPHI